MNNININASLLSEGVQKIVGVVERKQTMPILGHILIETSLQQYLDAKLSKLSGL